VDVPHTRTDDVATLIDHGGWPWTVEHRLCGRPRQRRPRQRERRPRSERL